MFLAISELYQKEGPANIIKHKTKNPFKVQIRLFASVSQIEKERKSERERDLEKRNRWKQDSPTKNGFFYFLISSSLHQAKNVALGRILDHTFLT